MDAIAYIILGIFLLLISYSVYELYNNKYLTAKHKTNYYFIIFAFPFLGSLVYFLTKRKYQKLNL